MNELMRDDKSLSHLGENLRFLRQQRGMSQEELAQRLDVTRQSVSKWESETAYPEMNTLLALCDLFQLDLDTLLRGSAQRMTASDVTGYHKIMCQLSNAVAAGVALILFGVGVLVGWTSYAERQGWSESIQLLGVAALLLCILGAVVLFVVTGIREDQFRKKHPVIQPFYPQATLDAFAQRYVWLIALPIAAILADVILLILLAEWMEQLGYEGFLVMVFLWIIGGAAAVLTWAGMRLDQYNIPKYNLSNRPEFRRKEELSGSLCGLCMLTATAIYVTMGLRNRSWNQDSWLFAVGGICCGIIAIVVEMIYDRRIKAALKEEEEREYLD